jgi:hypothetical protein
MNISIAPSSGGRHPPGLRPKDVRFLVHCRFIIACHAGVRECRRTKQQEPRMNEFTRRIRPHVQSELRAAAEAEQQGDAASAFAHLERAHVLGQASTVEHVRVHWHMLAWGWKHRKLREWIGQCLRIAGAATKTAVGLVPHGNTGGANISPFKRLPIPADLAARIAAARAATQ